MIVIETATGKKKTLRKTPIPLSFRFTNSARIRDIVIWNGIIIRLKRNVTLSEFQKVGSVRRSE